MATTTISSIRPAVPAKVPVSTTPVVVPAAVPKKNAEVALPPLPRLPAPVRTAVAGTKRKEPESSSSSSSSSTDAKSSAPKNKKQKTDDTKTVGVSTSSSSSSSASAPKKTGDPTATKKKKKAKTPAVASAAVPAAGGRPTGFCSGAYRIQHQESIVIKNAVITTLFDENPKLWVVGTDGEKTRNPHIKNDYVFDADAVAKYATFAEGDSVLTSTLGCVNKGTEYKNMLAAYCCALHYAGSQWSNTEARLKEAFEQLHKLRSGAKVDTDDDKFYADTSAQEPFVKLRAQDEKIKTLEARIKELDAQRKSALHTAHAAQVDARKLERAHFRLSVQSVLSASARSGDLAKKFDELSAGVQVQLQALHDLMVKTNESNDELQTELKLTKDENEVLHKQIKAKDAVIAHDRRDIEASDRLAIAQGERVFELTEQLREAKRVSNDNVTPATPPEPQPMKEEEEDEGTDSESEGEGDDDDDGDKPTTSTSSSSASSTAAVATPSINNNNKVVDMTEDDDENPPAAPTVTVSAPMANAATAPASDAAPPCVAKGVDQDGNGNSGLEGEVDAPATQSEDAPGC